jgi:hypothetical protein
MFIRYVCARISSNGREIERSLQIASGTALLTLLASLPATWELSSPVVRHAYVLMAQVCGLAFFSALTATFARILCQSVEDHASPMRSLLLLKVISWSLGTFGSIGTLLYFGARLGEILYRLTDIGT